MRPNVAAVVASIAASVRGSVVFIAGKKAPTISGAPKAARSSKSRAGGLGASSIARPPTTRASSTPVLSDKARAG